MRDHPTHPTSYSLLITALDGAVPAWEWPSWVQWRGGIPPILSTATLKFDMIQFMRWQGKTYGSYTLGHR